jgi:arsenical pump membrane protein
MILACLLFALTLVLVTWRPRGLGIGWGAGIGAALALAAGLVGPADVAAVWHIVWNATATLIAIIVTSLILDRAGLFEWCALHVARWGGGSGLRLFVLIVLLGATVTALFANDGAALILTPIIMEMMLAMGLGAPATIAFVMAAGFISDAASIPLVVSNLVNILVADFFGIGFTRYAQVMLPVNLAAVAASLAALLALYKAAIPRRYDVQHLPAPASAVRDPVTFRAGWVVLGLLLAGFFCLEPLGVPVSAVAAAGAASLLVVAGRRHLVGTRRIMREAPWHIVAFSLGMYLVVYGLRNAGLTAYLGGLLERCADHGVWGAAIGTGVTAALLSSVMNNLPAVLAVSLAIGDAQVGAAAREAMIYANIIGSDLGPKLTPIGSLATLLWLHVLANKGLTISWGHYLRVGAILTPPVLLATLAALALRLGA